MRTAVPMLVVLLLLASVPSAWASIVIHDGAPGIVAVNYSGQGGGSYDGLFFVLDSMGRVWQVRGPGDWTRDPLMDPPIPVSSMRSWDYMMLVTTSNELWTNQMHGGGWYSWGQWPGIADVEDCRAEPNRTAIAPNPTPGPCRVSFALAADGPVSVDLIDATGRTVRRLLDGPHPAGDYSLKWDGRDDAGRELPAGVYFTHVTTSQGTTTGRVVIAN